jgi:hypothetical protein
VVARHNARGLMPNQAGQRVYARHVAEGASRAPDGPMLASPDNTQRRRTPPPRRPERTDHVRTLLDTAVVVAGGDRADRPSPSRIGSDAVLGLPNRIRGCLFDLDGVLTQTATVHAAAWKEMFDAYLRWHAEQTNTAFVPFDPVGDYTYVDGKPRADGTRSFLQSREIELPEGTRHRFPRQGHRAGFGGEKKRDRAGDDPPRRRGSLCGVRPLRARGPRRRAGAGGGVVERQLPRCAGGGRHRGTLQCPHRRSRRQA